MDYSGWGDVNDNASIGEQVAAANVVKDAAGNVVLDFNDAASAEAQAAIVGGTVEPIGVAYRVVLPE
jgi:hypothetical protein